MNHVLWTKKLLVWANSSRHLFQQHPSMFALMHSGKNSWNLRESELDEVWSQATMAKKMIRWIYMQYRMPL